MQRAPSLLLALLFLSPAACDPGHSERDVPADEPGTETDDPSPGTDPPGDDPSMEPEAPYVIRGRAQLLAAAGPAPAALRGTRTAAGQTQCPFPIDSAPCNTPACWEDPESLECHDVVQTYCDNHPEHPECEAPKAEPEPDPLPPDPPPPEPDPGEVWACEVEPDWPPCEVCLDPQSAEQDCADAWREHCIGHPQDPWCDDGHDEEPPDAVYQPGELSLLVVQVEFSVHEDCSDPILVGESDEPRFVDFVSAPDLIAADLPPAGTYPCVIITMSDQIQWSVDGDTPCSGHHEQDIAGERGTEETVRLYLSTAGSDDDDYMDPFSAPGIVLDGALEVGGAALSSDFVIGFPDGVHYRQDAEVRCEMRRPEFGFVTHDS